MRVVTLIKCGVFVFDELMPGQSREVTFDLPDPRPASEFKDHVMRNDSRALPYLHKKMLNPQWLRKSEIDTQPDRRLT